EAFGTVAGGDAVSFKWEVSTDGTNFSLVAGAPNSAFYTIPENYINDFVSAEKSKELWFRCERTNPVGTTVTAALPMLFIRTNTSGYGEENGVKYLEIETKNRHYPGGTVKIALTNLGATNDNNLGDFYQWGRVGDGHQVIGWAKSTGTRDNIFDAATDANRYPGGTTQITGDGSANREPVGLTLTSSGQVTTGTNGYGKFILAGDATRSDWSNYATLNNRWGNGSTNGTNNRITDIAHSSWTFGAQPPAGNNPCPGGWSVPSCWQWEDMHDGNGSSTTFENGWHPATRINHWDFRIARHGAVGGAVITNAAGEKVFLPAAGYRYNGDGSLYSVGSNGHYWSSTPSGGFSVYSGAYTLMFAIGYVYSGNSTNSRAYGHNIRCVTE
ncbi:MAG: fibrobacter succinogenes major paralogous domain-containing protein, partial [Prevotellaceae bacterium]|nr:fibrobacter succinogenes major paralogous domain-containing protein [Prevotellaceae bacterium]